jgi:hypothetical protein
MNEKRGWRLLLHQSKKNKQETTGKGLRKHCIKHPYMSMADFVDKIPQNKVDLYSALGCFMQQFLVCFPHSYLIFEFIFVQQQKNSQKPTLK